MGTQGWQCTTETYQGHNWYYRENETNDCYDNYDNDCDGKTDMADTADCCEANCTGKSCGDDGCGGSCGTCDTNYECVEGKCQATCGSVTYTCKNRCGQQYDVYGYYYCNAYSCEQNPSHCAPDFYSCCGGGCVADCNGKQCGDDGCGGSCGTCSSGYTCDAYGTCQYNANVGCGSSYTACKNCVCSHDSYCCSGWDSACSSGCYDNADCKAPCGY
jgi:hypothetical protein